MQLTCISMLQLCFLYGTMVNKSTDDWVLEKSGVTKRKIISSHD